MKKVTIVIILAVLILVGSLAFWQYSVIKTEVWYDNEGAKTEIKEEQKNLSEATSQNDNMDTAAEENKLEGNNGGGTFTVCLDKCGDGICQKPDPNCKNDLNCVCPETKTDCSEDCK